MYMVRAMAGERGASVVAALVLAAIFAGTAMVVSELDHGTIPVAESQSAGAATGSSKASQRCEDGFDAEVKLITDSKGARAEINPIEVCKLTFAITGTESPVTVTNQNATSLFGKPQGRCEHAYGGLTIVPRKPWTCIQKYCEDKEKPCQYTTVPSGKTFPSPSQSPTQTPAGGAADPSGTPGTGTQQPGVQAPGDQAQNDILNDALKEVNGQQDEIEKKSQALQDQFDATQDRLAQLGCGKVGESFECTAVRAEQAGIRKELEDITKNYDELNTQKAILSDSSNSQDTVDACYNSGVSESICDSKLQSYCSTDAGKSDAERCGAGAPRPDESNRPCQAGQVRSFDGRCLTVSPNQPPAGGRTGFEAPGYQGQTSAACRACQQNSENYNDCMACRQGGGQGSNPFGQQGQQRGGQGGGSGAQQAQQQQQCQPQYQCSSNVVMYNACPNVNGSWQQVQQCQTGYTCSNNSCVAQAPYGYCTNGQPRTAPAQSQPSAASCTVGSWQDTSNGCQTSWQCVASGSTATSTINPTAQLSCQPTVADENTVISFSYACANGATIASSTGFTLTPSILSGSASTTATLLGSSGATITYGLMCTNENVSPARTASAQCVVQVGKSSIVLVATPKTVYPNDADAAKHKTTIGWVTSGMRSCVIGNPDFPAWTAQQAGNTSVGGAVTSPDIPSGMTKTTFTLACTAIGGASKAATVEVVSE